MWSENELHFFDDEDISKDDDISDITAILPSTRNFVEEISLVLKTTNDSNNNNNNETALKINQEMQRLLQEMKSTLNLFLKKCELKQKHNEELLKLPSLNKAAHNLKRFYRTYNYCGIPFFKTEDSFNCPPNDDYIKRKKRDEIFQADLLLNKQNYWSLNDKRCIIQGIKEQAIEYINSKQRQQPSTSIALTNKEDLGESNLVSLLNQCDENFKISWYRISSEHVKHRFIESSCEAMWNMYLKPNLNRNQWSAEENKRLMKVSTKWNFENWAKIAEEVKNRSEFQCFVQYFAVLVHQQKAKCKKWTPKDDEKLLRIVKQSRMNNIIRWSLVKQHFPHLSKKQLHHRYQYSIDPSINKAKFTTEEDCLILSAIEKYGENFQSFPLGLFPGRTIVQIRNRYHNTLKISGKHSCWSVEDDIKLWDLVQEHGIGNWSIMSNLFVNKSRSSIRQRYLTIQKFLEKNPGCTIKQCPRKQRPLKTDVTINNWQEKALIKVSGQTSKALKTDANEADPLKYYNSLRSLEKRYYQFFKYSYDFKFNTEFVPLYNPLRNVNFLVNMFKIDINEDLFAEITHKFSESELTIINNLINLRKDKSNCKTLDEDMMLPPSWSTLLGLRGICIECASTTTKRKRPERPVRDTPQGDAAKERFRKIFFKLFYKTALLTRIDNFFIPQERIDLYNKFTQDVIAANTWDDPPQPVLKQRNSSSDDYDDFKVKQIKLEE